MTTSTLLKGYVWLRDELAASGPSEILQIERMNLFERLYQERQRQNYERARIEYAVYREFLGSPDRFTDEDNANLDAAWAIDQEITALLHEPTPSKRGRRATRGPREDAE